MSKICILLAALTLASASDWLNVGGDAQRTGWQKRGKLLSPSSVRGLRLLWKHKLGEGALTAPVILGRIITHRGIKELVLVAGASDDVYAVDADLGTLFWKRHLESAAKQDCGGGLRAAPALTPPPAFRGKIPDDDDDEGLPRTTRPLYVLSSEGMLHGLNPLNGNDVSPAVRFLPPDAKASSLNLVGNVAYTKTSGGCAGAADGVWAIDVGGPDAKGSVGRRVDSKFAEARLSGLTAAWQDASGTRWIYAASGRSVKAFQAAGKPVWVSRDLVSPGAPVIAGGVVFTLAGSVLYALDASSGRELYSSGNAIASSGEMSALAVANGHVCFGTADGTLYCFGFPMDL